MDEPESIEVDLFPYGIPIGSATMTRALAEKAVIIKVGQKIILSPGFLQIVSMRLKDNPAYLDGSRGMAIATCLILKREKGDV